MRVLVCDDEALARARLDRLTAGCGMEVVGEAATGRQALEMVGQLRPDLVLMDIRMPDMDGLEAAAHLARLEAPPALMFCTAYEEHALRAFGVGAVDYLLKPVSAADLARALDRARSPNRMQLENMARELATGSKPRRHHLSARTANGGLQLVPVDDVHYCQSDHKYVAAHHAGGCILLNDTLKALEDEFPQRFVRIHRSTLVAVQLIERVSAQGAGRSFVHLRGIERRLPVSRRYLPNLRRLLLGGHG